MPKSRNHSGYFPRGDSSFARVFALAGLLLAGLGGGAKAQVTNATNTTSFSTSTLTIDHDTQQYQTQQTNSYVTEILGKLNAGTVFDQTFNAAFSDPAVQAGVASARTAITAAGGPGVVIVGPTLLSQTTTLLSSTSSTTTTVTATNVSESTTEYIGPQTIKVGANQSNRFTLQPGQVDYDTLITSDVYRLLTTTTTNNDLITSLYQLTGTVQAIGTVHGAVGEAGFDQVDRFSRRLLQAGLDDRAFVGSAPPGSGPLAYAEAPDPGPIGAMLARKGPAGSLENPSPWHAWAEGYGYAARQWQSGALPGNVRDAVGVNGGLGYDLLQNFRLGLAFDFGGSKIDSDAVGEHANVNLSQLALYGAWRSGPSCAAFAATYGWGSASSTVAPIGLGATASSNQTLTTASLSGETGYHIPMDAFILTPTLGASWTHVETGAFTEAGSALALTGPSDSYNRVKGWLGLQGDASIDLSGSKLALMAYSRALLLGGDHALDLPVTFVGSTTPLTIDGANTGTFGVDLGAAASYRIAPNAELFATYDLRLRNRFMSQTGSGGLKVTF